MDGETNTLGEFVRDFRATVDAAAARMTDLPEDEESTGDVWNRKEILGHLIDSAANNHQRFVRAQFTSELIFPGYEQDKWVSAQQYSNASWANLVQLWRQYNLHLAHLISVTPDEVLTKSRSTHNLDEIAWQTVPSSQPTTLEYLIRDYAGHLRHHLDQIFKDDNN